MVGECLVFQCVCDMCMCGCVVGSMVCVCMGVYGCMCVCVYVQCMYGVCVYVMCVPSHAGRHKRKSNGAREGTSSAKHVRARAPPVRLAQPIRLQPFCLTATDRLAHGNHDQRPSTLDPHTHQPAANPPARTPAVAPPLQQCLRPRSPPTSSSARGSSAGSSRCPTGTAMPPATGSLA